MTETTAPDPLEAWFAAEADAFLERANEEFADSILLVARALGPWDEVSAATMTGIDREGVECRAVTPAGEEAARIGFLRTLEVPDHVGTALFELVAEAEARSGGSEPTSAQRQAEAMSRIRTFVTEVSAVAEVHPRLRRITVKGGDLATFEPCGPDTFLYALLPPPGRRELTVDQSFTWEAYATTPIEEQPVGAYYTVRAWRPEQQELDLLCVLHDNDGGDHAPHADDHPNHGAASRWAAVAAPGDPVALWGPRTAYEPPAETTHWVLVADETGLPAVAVIIEHLPLGATAQVIAEVGRPEEQQDLPARSGVEVTWTYRAGAPAGRTTNLIDAVRALPPLPDHTYVWGGGESKAMTAVRRHVRDERGLAREEVGLIAYWRHQATEDTEVEPA